MPIGAMDDLASVTLAPPNLVWETALDWDNAVSKQGVVDEATADTDHNDDTIVKQGFSAASPSPAGSNLHFYYPSHENSGTTANDFSGNSNDGTLNGVTPGVSGPLGTTAFGYDGTDDYLDTGFSAESGTFSVAGWIKTTETDRTAVFGWNTNNGDNILLEANADDGFNQQNGWVQFDHKLNGNLNILDTGGDTGFNNGNWHFLGARADVTNDELAIFVDDTKYSGAFSLGDTSWNVPAYWGARNDDGGGESFYINCDLWDLRLYDTAISDADFGTLYDTLGTPGTLTTATKSFASAQTPDLTAGVTMNGVTDIKMDVIGSPSGTSETNTVQVTGDGTFSITWSNSHTDFRVKLYPDNESDFTRTPTINRVELS